MSDSNHPKSPGQSARGTVAEAANDEHQAYIQWFVNGNFDLFAKGYIDLDELRRRMFDTLHCERELATIEYGKMLFELLSIMKDLLDQFIAHQKKIAESRMKSDVGRRIVELRDNDRLSFGRVAIKLKREGVAKMSSEAVKKMYSRRRRSSTPMPTNTEWMDALEEILAVHNTLIENWGGDEPICPQKFRELPGMFDCVPFSEPTDTQQS